MERRESWASPVVARGRLVYVQRDGDQLHLDCLEAATGKRYWRRSIPCDYQPRYVRNGGPRSSPVIDGDWVYVHYTQGRLACLELATGRVRWERELCAEFGVGEDYFGVVSSPLVAGDLLIQNLGAPDGGCVIALDKASGKVAWASGDEWGPSCASPVLGDVHGRERLFVFAGGDSRPPTGGLVVLDPKDGAIDFRFPFRSRRYESVNASTPVVCGERVFVSDGYGTGTAVLGLDAEGGFEELWRSRSLGLEFTTPVYLDGHLYLCDGVNGRAGAVVCLDPASGEELVRADLDFDETVTRNGEERALNSSIGQGSLLAVDGHLLCLGDTGQLLWLRASPQRIEVVSRAALFHASETWTPPVVCQGLLYVCQNNRDAFAGTPARLLCYDLRATE
jgi:outer membrane protein assembly factor BamB